VDFPPIGWDPDVSLLLAGIVKPIIVDGKGLLREGLKTYLIDHSFRENLPCSILSKKFSFNYHVRIYQIVLLNHVPLFRSDAVETYTLFPRIHIVLVDIRSVKIQLEIIYCLFVIQCEKNSRGRENSTRKFWAKVFFVRQLRVKPHNLRSAYIRIFFKICGYFPEFLYFLTKPRAESNFLYIFIRLNSSPNSKSSRSSVHHFSIQCNIKWERKNIRRPVNKETVVPAWILKLRIRRKIWVGRGCVCGSAVLGKLRRSRHGTTTTGSCTTYSSR